MKFFNKIFLAIILCTLFVLAGCGSLNDVIDTISSLTEDDTDQAETNEIANNNNTELAGDTPDQQVHTSSNNPYHLSSDLVSFINGIGALLIIESDSISKDEFIEEVLVNLDYSNEAITEAEVRELLDDLYLSFDAVPTDYPLPVLPNAIYYNYAFIGVGYEYDSDNTYDYWLGQVDFDQSIEEAIDFYREALAESGFEITDEAVGEENTLGIGDAIITSIGEVNGLPYEAGFLFTEHADGPNQVMISIEYKVQ